MLIVYELRPLEMTLKVCNSEARTEHLSLAFSSLLDLRSSPDLPASRNIIIVYLSEATRHGKACLHILRHGRVLGEDDVLADFDVPEGILYLDVLLDRRINVRNIFLLRIILLGTGRFC